MSKGDNIRGMSAVMWLKRDKIIEIRRFSSSKNFVRKRKYLIVYSYTVSTICEKLYSCCIGYFNLDMLL